MVRAADPDMRWQVNEILDTSKAMGLKVLRTWAFSEGPIAAQPPPLLLVPF